MDTRKGLFVVVGALLVTAALYAIFRAARTPLDRAESLYFQRKYPQAETALLALLRGPLTPADRCKAEFLLGRVHLGQPKYDVVHESVSRWGGLWESTLVVTRNYSEALPHFLRADSLAAQLSPPDSLLSKRIAFWAGKCAFFLGDSEMARGAFAAFDSAAAGYLSVGPYVRDPSISLSDHPSSVSGRILWQGSPIKGVHIVLVRAQKEGYASVVSDLVGRLEDWVSMRKLKHPGNPPRILVTGDLWYHTTSDRTGRFAVETLEPGSYEWEVFYDASLFGTRRGHYTLARDIPKVEAPKDTSRHLTLPDMVMCERVRALDPPGGALLPEGEATLRWQWRTFPAQTPFKVKLRVSGMISTGAALGVLDSTETIHPASGDTITGAFCVRLAPGNYLWEMIVATQADTLITSQKTWFSLLNPELPAVTRDENDSARSALREAQKRLLHEPLSRIGRLERCARKYPHTTWAPNAMYDIAYAYLRAKDVGQATNWLEKVIEAYADSQQARWAETALRKIKEGDLNIQLL